MKKSFWAIAVLLLVLTACDSQSNLEATSAAQETRIASTVVETTGTRQVVPTSTEKPSPSQTSPLPTATETRSVAPTEAGRIDSHACSADNWGFLPTGFYEYPMEDGWKIIVIEFSVQNNSPFWGKVVTHVESWNQVTTDAGFVYEGIPTQSLDVAYPIDLATSNHIETPLLPPGFTTSGTGYGVDRIIPRGDHSFHFIFKVAETSRSYDFEFKGGTVACPVSGTGEDSLQEGEYFLLEGLDVHVDPENLSLPQYPFSGQVEGIPDASLDDPISVENGTITFTGVERGRRSLTLRFEFENLDKGYDAEGELSGAIIGDDGIMRPGSGGDYRAGPGQKYQDGEIRFPLPSGVADLYLILDDQHVIYLSDNL